MEKCNGCYEEFDKNELFELGDYIGVYCTECQQELESIEIESYPDLYRD